MNGLSSLLIRAVLAVVVLAACVAPAVAQEVVEYIHTDALGSPVAITDASGNVIERTVYEPYGAVVNRPLKDGPGYTGHVTDSGTGLIYMQQRYFDPSTGVFLSVDPVAADTVTGGNFARYLYANGNPYKYADPDGRIGKLIAELIKKILPKILPKASPKPAPKAAPKGSPRTEKSLIVLSRNQQVAKVLEIDFLIEIYREINTEIPPRILVQKDHILSLVRRTEGSHDMIRLESSMGMESR